MAQLQKAAALRKDKNFAEADTLLKDCLLEAQAKKAESPVVARVLDALGDSYYEQAMYDEAEKYWRQALDVRRKICEPTDIELILNLESLGKLAYRNNKQEEAQALYGEAKTLRGQKDEADKKKIASFQSQGVAALKASNHSAAINAFAEILRVSPKHLIGQKNLFIAYDNQGIGFYEKQQYVAAETSFKQAIALTEKYPAIARELKADAIHNLASLYHRQGKFTEAETHYKQAIEILTQCQNKLLLPRAISNYNDLQTDMRRRQEQKKFRQQKETANN
jgi:tetratricopeptide (TPR) repeat protein